MESLFRKVNPGYRHRYEVYNELVSGELSSDKVWVDVGCGCNENVAVYGTKTKLAVGLDAMIHPELANAPFIQASLRSIPLRSGCADIVTLRMVVEHLEKIPGDFEEIERILKPGGKMVVLTTNSLSPLVFFPGLLPYRLKEGLIRKTFHTAAEDVFPTFHRCNTPGAMKNGIGELRLSTLQFLEQVPLSSPGLTMVFGGWYIIARLPFLAQLRSTMLAVFEKRN
ncbi:MAG: class I SAM-dependent methyltransferase [Ignavibacteriales bacterium]|nr:class I SAM-dependent methyltransferase [Ignavibacteriales bacterium]